MLLIGEQSPTFPKVSDFQALVASTIESITPLRQQCHLLFLINGKTSVEMVEIALYSKAESEESQRSNSILRSAQRLDRGLCFSDPSCIT